jgi:hypothetical protein
MTLIITATAVATVGFLAGLLTAKKSEHWCPVCGVTLQCPDPHRAHAAPIDDRP